STACPTRATTTTEPKAISSLFRLRPQTPARPFLSKCRSPFRTKITRPMFRKTSLPSLLCRQIHGLLFRKKNKRSAPSKTNGSLLVQKNRQKLLRGKQKLLRVKSRLPLKHHSRSSRALKVLPKLFRMQGVVRERH